MAQNRESLDIEVGDLLNSLYETYHHPRFLNTDPLEFVHRYQDPWDQEAVAVIAAVLAYGQVKQIRRSIQDLLDRMEKTSGSPKQFIRELEKQSFQKKAALLLEDFVHRFNKGEDILLLLGMIQQSWYRCGSVGGHFLIYLQKEHSDISGALNRFILDWRNWASGTVSEDSSFHYLLTSPSDGSCCKRWCMLLRWMGRQDALDPGLWTAGSPLSATFPKGKYLSSHQLVMPMDTHTGRISQELGLTERKSLNWQAALEVTQKLKELDPFDPVRFDFSLCRKGMLEDED